MPCALSASIMSTKYAHEGNQRGFSVSTTSGNEMSERQIKNSISSTSAEGSVQQLSPAPYRDNATSSLPGTTSRSQHSFSIDALVGNNKSHEDDVAKPAGSSPGKQEMAATESWPNHLIDLKRIQAYYQQMYNQNFPLKQLNNYMYPLGSFTEAAEASKQSETFREKDQILAYYANLYLQSSNFYQEQYLESLRTFSTDTAQQSSKESVPEFFHKYEKIAENESEEATQRLLSKENERGNSSHLLSNDLSRKDHFLRLKQYPNSETPLSNSTKSNDTSPKSSSASDQLLQPPALQSSLLFPGVNKQINLASQSTLRSTFQQQLVGSQSVSTSLNGSNSYSSYCDYDLLDLQNKSSLLVAGGNSDSATPNSLHSPQLETDSSSRPSPPGGIQNGGGNVAAAAAAAYHLSSMFRKPKRIRTAFSPGQLLRLEEIFEKNRYVVGCERKQLARDLNLSETQIKVWFQNRRTKHKREKHISVGQSGDHSMNSRLRFSEEKKASSTSRSATISSSSTSSSSSSSAGYLSNGSFTMPPASSIYGHFKSQNSTHRTLLAK